MALSLWFLVDSLMRDDPDAGGWFVMGRGVNTEPPKSTLT